MGVRAMLRWIGDRVPFMPAAPPAPDASGPSELKRATERADHAVRRADRAVDVFNEQIRQGYGLPGERWDA